MLGVDKNAELRSIKRAYAALIKQYRPESHPEKFSDIRLAYEFARDNRRAPGKADAEQFHESDVPEEHESEDKFIEIVEPNHAVSTDKHEEFLREVDNWIGGGFRHDEEFCRILEHEIHDTWSGFQMAKVQVFERLLESISIGKGIFSTSLNIDCQYLAKLDQLYRWRQDEIELHEVYEHENVALVFYGIELGYGLVTESDGSSPRMTGTRRKFILQDLSKSLIGFIVAIIFILWVFSV